MNEWDENLEKIEASLTVLKDYFEGKDLDFVVAWHLNAHDDDKTRSGISHTEIAPVDFGYALYEWARIFARNDTEEEDVDDSHLN